MTRNRNLIELRLDHNQLLGTLPPELDSLRQLQQLNLETNRFQGPLPDIFGRLHLLQVLELQNNTLGQYHDEPEKPARVPTSLGAMTNLSKLHHYKRGFYPRDATCYLGVSKYSSPISTGILKINTNLFRGDIPRDWWNMTSLEVIHLVRLRTSQLRNTSLLESP